MPKKSDRSKKKKFRRTKKKSKPVFVRGKTGKHKCAICKSALHGTPHGKKPSEVKKLPKTKRRPTAIFAGTLCTKCRSKVASEAAKVEAKAKKMEDVEIMLKKYVEKVKVQ